MSLFVCAVGERRFWKACPNGRGPIIIIDEQHLQIPRAGRLRRGARVDGMPGADSRATVGVKARHAVLPQSRPELLVPDRPADFARAGCRCGTRQRVHNLQVILAAILAWMLSAPAAGAVEAAPDFELPRWGTGEPV